MPVNPGALAALARIAGGGGAAPPPPGPRPPVAGMGPRPMAPLVAPQPGRYSSVVAALQQAAGRPRPRVSGLVLAPPTATRPKPPAAPRGLLRQIGDVFSGLPKGVGMLGASLGKELLHAVPNPNPLKWGEHGDPGLHNITEESNPLTVQLARSFKNTGMDVRHPTRFQQAVREGRIVDKILEDAANASIVGGAAGKALTAAGAGLESPALLRAGEITTRAAELGGETANAPISVPRAVIRGTGERVLPAIGRRTIPFSPIEEAIGRRPTVGERFPGVFSPEGRARTAVVKQGYTAAERERAGQLRTAHKLATKQERLAGNPSLDEQAAAVALYSGQARNLMVQAERLGVPVSELGDVFAPSKVPEAHLTPEAAQIIEDIHNGVADPAVQARVLAGRDKLLHDLERVTREAMDPETRRRTPLEPEQVYSDEVLPRVVDMFAKANKKDVMRLGEGDAEFKGMMYDFGEDMSPREVRAAKLEAGKKLLEDPDTNLADFPELADKWNELLNDPRSYAARWRPRMMEAQRARTHALATGLEAPAIESTRPVALADAGVEARYIPMGRPTETIPAGARVGTKPLNEGVAGDFLLSSEKARTGAIEGPMSYRTVYSRLGQEARTGALNEAYRTLVDVKSGLGARTADSVLGEGALAEFADQARAEAMRRYPGDVSPKGKLKGKAALEYRRLYGESIKVAMAGRGLDAWWTPEMAGGATKSVSSLDTIPTNLIDERTPFLPTGEKARLSQWWLNREPPLPLRYMEAINRKFKGAVLPWSLRWQVGDAMSNMLLAWAAGGVNPGEMFARFKQLRRLTPEEEALLDARVQDVGLTFNEEEWRRGLPGREAVRFREHPIKAAQQPGYRLNSWINRTQRHAFYLEKLERELEAQGSSLKQAGAEAAAGRESPKTRAAIDHAVRQANDVMGAFDEMTPRERRIVRNLVPFYPWLRHITRLTMRLAVDNPARIMWIMRLGSIGTDPNSELPPFLRGGIQTPVGMYDPNFLNPFADSVGNSPLSIEGGLRSLSPAVKLPIAAVLGADLNRGGLQLTRPTGTGRQDPYGRQGFTTLLTPNRWDELAYVASQYLPQSRTAVNLLPEWKVGDVQLGPVARYQAGAEVHRPGETVPIRHGRVEDVLHLLSIPTPYSQRETQEMIATLRRRRKQNAKRKPR